MRLRRIPNLIWRAIMEMANKNGIEIAGYIAFTAILALFPFLIFLVSVAGFLGDTSTGQNLIGTIAMFAPPDMMRTLEPAIHEVTENRSGGLLTIGLLLALYSASSGVEALRLALNLAYGVVETRSFWFRKGQSFLIVICTSALLIAASTLILLGPFLIKILFWFTPFNPANEALWHVGRYVFALLAFAGSIIGLHKVLPNETMTFKEILPGALVTTAVWIIAAVGLTIYIGDFAQYSATYGSLGGVVVTLLFFYVSGAIFIFGGELNARLLAADPHRRARMRQASHQKRSPDDTDASPRPPRPQHPDAARPGGAAASHPGAG